MVSGSVNREIVFVALTRPQMFAGVTYTFFIINGIIAAELFLLFKAMWVIGVAAIIHLIGVIACLSEPRFFDLWIARVRYCPRVRNFALWGCNSYAP